MNGISLYSSVFTFIHWICNSDPTPSKTPVFPCTQLYVSSSPMKNISYVKIGWYESVIIHTHFKSRILSSKEYHSLRVVGSQVEQPSVVSGSVVKSWLCNGGTDSAASRPWIVSKALICWPTPYLPSYAISQYQCSPHVAPFEPPEQALAAARELPCKYVVIWLFVKGAMRVEAHMKRERYPLKEYWSLSQVSTVSQAVSTITFDALPYGLKYCDAACKKPWVRWVHRSEPSV